MSAGFEANLGPERLGAELLARVAAERGTGVFICEIGDKRYHLHFSGGRPELYVGSDGARRAEREAVIKAVRALALLTSGGCSFVPQEVPAGALAIDTLGEVLVALLHAVPEAQLPALWTARVSHRFEATPRFERVAAAIVSARGPQLVRPAAAVSATELAVSAGVAEQRAWLCMLVLGGLQRVAPEVKQGPVVVGDAVPTASAGAPRSGTEAPPLPSDAKAREVALEVKLAFERAKGQTYYDVLGVKQDATADDVRKAYFEAAKRWHSDRFAGLELGEYARWADDLFRLVAEAHQILGNAEKRSDYDFVLERKAKGLPTDVNVILEAEGLFVKGKSLVRRGQAANAEPLLRKAVEMNPGEAEFWSYCGFAIYSANGKAGLAEAQEKLKKALEMNPKLDSAYEFMGKIARVEGDAAAAERHFKKCLSLNAKNVEAERELRLVQMRAAKGGDKSAAGLFGKLFKKP